MATTTIDQFVNQLVHSGLMSPADVESFFAELPDGEPRDDAQRVAQALVRAGKLTKYQATAIYQGKAEHLVLGDYEVLARIGAGGMGQVYRARHRRMKREVALKLISPEITKTPEALTRFEREVEAAARLTHANIVTAYDAGEDKGIHYLVMELVEGGDLHSVVTAQGPLPIEQSVDCIMQAAHGLDYAHTQGVIHRDIKPANLLLAASDQQSAVSDSAIRNSNSAIVKILDMGLARLEDQVASTDTTMNLLTGQGMIMGTVDYMAPEQAVNTHAADHRSDIYSLGCTMFYLLTGQQIYDGQTPVEKLVAHRERLIPSLAQLRDDVPEPIDSVFQRMVAKNPDDRFQSMTEVIAAVEEALSLAGSRIGKDSSSFAWQESEDPHLASFLKGVATGQKPQAKTTTESNEIPETVALSSAGLTQSESTQAASDDKQPTAKKPAKPNRGTLLIALAVGGTALMFVALVGLMWYLVGGPDKDNGNETAEDVTNQVRRSGSPELQALADRVKQLNANITSMPDPNRDDVKKLRADLLAFARGKQPNAESLAAMRLLSFVPAPADLLRRVDIDPYELTVASRQAKRTRKSGINEGAAPEIVAIYGDSRMKHWGAAYAVAYSPDGKTIVSGGSDGFIRFWDSATGRETKTLVCADRVVHAIDVDSTGKTVAALTANGKLFVWKNDVDTPLFVASAHEPSRTASYLPSVAFGPRDELFTGGHDGLVKEWDVTTGKSLRAIEAHTKAVTCVDRSRDGAKLASSLEDGEVKVWDRDANESILTIEDHPDPVHAVAFSHNGKWLASGSGVTDKSGQVLVHDVTTGEIVARLPRKLRGNAVSFSHDDSKLAASAWNGRATWWDTREWDVPHHLTGTSNIVQSSVTNALAFSPDDDHLAVADYSGAVRIWDVATNDLVSNLSAFLHARTGNGHSVEPMFDGTGFVSTADGILRTFRFGNDNKQSKQVAVPHAVTVRQSPSGDRLVTAQTRIIQFWNPNEFSEIGRWTAESHTSNILRCCVSPDGKTLATGSYDSTINVWTYDGKQVKTFDEHTGPVNFVSFSPDGKLLASSSADKTARLWNVASGKAVHVFKIDGTQQGVAFSPDGMTFAYCDGDEVVMWDVNAQKEIHRLRGSQKIVRAVNFSPTGQHLATASEDGYVRVWSAVRGKLIKEIPVGPQAYFAEELHFTPDSRHLITANKNGTAYVLRIHSPWPEDSRPTSNTKAPTTPKPDIRIPKFDDPPPLDEWLKGREILTVRQDGTADYTTIQSALDALKPGQAVHVLDRGPYVENLAVDDAPDNTGLVSDAGTILAPKMWQDWTGKTHQHRAHWISASGTFRLSGITFDEVEELPPTDAKSSYLLWVRVESEGQIENCVLRRESLDDNRNRQMGALRVFHAGGKGAGPLVIRHCACKGMVGVTGNSDSLIALDHNWFSWTNPALGIGNDHRGRLVYHTNIIHAEPGPGFYMGTISDNSSTVEFYNNSVFAKHGATKFDFDAFPKKQKVTIRNNLLHGQIYLGSNAIPFDDDVLKKWSIAGNLIWPEGYRDDVLVSPYDKFRDPSYLSLDPTHRDYFRTARDGPAANSTTLGQSYIGALPPGSAPQEGDWFTRLMDRWRDVTNEDR